MTLTQRLKEKEQELSDCLKHLRQSTETNTKVKAAVRSMTERMMTYLMQPTPGNLYAVHQILRNVEELLGDLDFRRP